MAELIPASVPTMDAATLEAQIEASSLQDVQHQGHLILKFILGRHFRSLYLGCMCNLSSRQC